MMPRAGTCVFALLGDPVTHSLSPAMHNAAFRAMGLDAVYVALRPTAGQLHAIMTTLVRDGGGGNVTIPFKAAAADAGDARGELTQVLGVANVFGPTTNHDVRVDNTDVAGMAVAIARLGVRPRTIGVVGTGGSARAAVGVARGLGATIAVRSRATDRATAFAAWAASIGVPSSDWSACDLVINATPLGLRADDPLPIAPVDVPIHAAVLDLTYRPRTTTAWIAACNAAGHASADGRAVLLAQGAASWAHWFAGVAPPLEVMQAVLDGCLA
jgi:shikimate dehydrogenase